MISNFLIKNGSGNPTGRSLVEKICRMIDLEWEVVVKHSLCEANQCVDVLANYGCSLNGESRF